MHSKYDSDTEQMIRVMLDMTMFTEKSSLLRLREYRLAVARAILESILDNYSDSLVVNKGSSAELNAWFEAH